MKFSFQRLDIRGKIKPLHGQNRKTEEPLALFCICTPFGPPSLLEMPQKEIMFKSKHKLDLGIVSFEQRGKDLFGYTEVEFSNKGIYDLVHPEDLTYVAQAHNERKSIIVEMGLKPLPNYLLGSNQYFGNLISNIAAVCQLLEVPY